MHSEGVIGLCFGHGSGRMRVRSRLKILIRMGPAPFTAFYVITRDY